MRFCSIFNQLLQLFPRADFQGAVKEYEAERHARGFTCWGQFVAMLFCQLGKAQSLREIVGGLASCEGRLAHLGITAPKRSTLAYANEHRPWQLYQAVFYQLLARCQAVAPKNKFRFKNKLLSLDATIIDLCAELFPWAAFRRTKGAVKLHFTLDHDGYLPTVLTITEGKRRETPIARQQQFAPGTILVLDRGYLDLSWFAELTAAGVYFVTRLRTTARYRVVARRPVPQHRGIVADQDIRFTGKASHRSYPDRLRRVALRTPEGDRLEFVTNHLTLGASTVARVYQDRWQIELFFKWIKQHLRIKAFFGTSENAVKTQIWIAVAVYVLVAIVKKRLNIAPSLYEILQILSLTMFERIPLDQLLNNIIADDIQTVSPNQLNLFN